MRAKTPILSLESNIYWRFLDFHIKKKKNEWYIICPYGLGDTYLVCALANELLKQKGGEGVKVFVKSSQRDIPALFPGIKNIYIYNPQYNIH